MGSWDDKMISNSWCKCGQLIVIRDAINLLILMRKSMHYLESILRCDTSRLTWMTNSTEWWTGYDRWQMVDNEWWVGGRDWWWQVAAAAAPGAAPVTSTTVAAATVNSKWQVDGRWAWTQARANEVKQAGQYKQQDQCEWWAANGQWQQQWDHRRQQWQQQQQQQCQQQGQSNGGSLPFVVLFFYLSEYE